ncbi:GntR family transcriptional regulator [Amycolatopsis acidicola]|uniref:GntR family transcriptional regulator n=1 Tax=Amycolatopsis acidicola TaxID=2596893 RepID=A0A5N0UNS2_9PSEU|nr:GntR family transcriptional regulator [Amycolatopsis acidicola]KAA9149216.1 GntR family transcriptional regulator [Amycolatopsis acidicola]
MPRSAGLPRRPQLADEVAAHLRNLIMSGEARPGEYLRLDQVAAELGVSVTPVREALAALRGEDMVELEPHRGFVVAPLSEVDVADMFELQAGLATTLLGRAAANLSAGDLDELERLNDELADAANVPDPAELERLEYDFHRAINRAAHSRKLSWFLRNATVYLPRPFYSSDPEWRELTVASHRKILRALRKGDVATGGVEMHRHVTESGARLIAHLEKTGLWREE